MDTEKVLARLRRKVGSTVNGKYRLDALLGVGGMAAVYAATHRNGGRIALKVLHAELSSMPDVRKRFLREGYAANKVGHPGVVRVLDDDHDPDGSVFLVMELLEGRTLEDLRLTSGGRLAVGEAVPIVLDVLEILDAAHLQRIIHRDIKPENVFLSNLGTTKLMDFGIARVLDASIATAAGSLMGTPAYMSPEQAGGRNADVDARSDVWSVGALLFVLSTGRDVHLARTAAEQLIYAATQPACSISSVMPGLAPEVAHVIDTALAFEPRHRWQTAQAMRSALRYAMRRHAGIAPGRPASLDRAQASAPASLPTLIQGSGSSSDELGAPHDERR